MAEADPNQPDYSSVEALRRQWQQSHDPTTGDVRPSAQPSTVPATAQPAPAARPAVASPATVPSAAPASRTQVAPPTGDVYSGNVATAGDLLIKQPLTGFLQDVGPLVGTAQSALHQNAERNRILPWSGEDIGNPIPAVSPDSWTTTGGAERLTGAINPSDPRLSPLGTFNVGAMRAAGAVAPFSVATGFLGTPAAGFAVQGGGMLVGGLEALAERYASPYVADIIGLGGALAFGPETLASRVPQATSILGRLVHTAGHIVAPVGATIDAGRWALDRVAQIAVDPRRMLRAAGVLSSGQIGSGRGSPLAPDSTNALAPGVNPAAIQ